MNKLKFETKSGAERNIKQIAGIFPEVITETRDASGNLVKTVNFDTLKSLLGDVVEGRAESYDFTWVGKREALIEADAPIRKTLRPAKADSVNWDTTQNLYIEGDNLDVLKLLTDSYLGKVKMIYIDPPYNTGKDFVYKDEFTMDKDEYDEDTKRVDDDGNVNFKENMATNPRFHSDWCSMIYPRLKVARNLLTDDGVIFISIDDNEQANLRKICDEVFGASNFVADLIWTNKEGGGSSDSKWYKIKHEHIIVYAKSIENLIINQEAQLEDGSYNYQDDFVLERGKYKLIKLNSFSIQYSQSLDYPIEYNGETIYPSENGKRGCWRWSKQRYEWGAKNGFIVIKKGADGETKIYTKQYFKVDNDCKPINRSLPPLALIDKYSSTGATKQMEELLGAHIFDYSKPLSLVKDLIKNATNNGSLILDFFSGSATTAHAVMQLNAEDGGNRKFILVQLPEKTDENSEAYKAGYKNICEIGKERIRRAGKKILETIQSNQQMNLIDMAEYIKNEGLFDFAGRLKAKNIVDMGFRVFKLDDSNFMDVHFSAGKLAEMSIFDTLAENLKEDRTAEDLLYSCILEWGLSLSSDCAKT
jgi:adenine-specific DNA-methyltransferase